MVNTDTKRWIPIGNWVSNTSNVHDIPGNASFLDINLTKLEMLWKKVFNSSHEMTSVCGKRCPPGHFMNLEERYPVRFSSVFAVYHKYYNFLNCDWFKKLLFPTNSLAKLLSDSSTNQSNSSCSLNQPITFKVVV